MARVVQDRTEGLYGSSQEPFSALVVSGANFDWPHATNLHTQITQFGTFSGRVTRLSIRDSIDYVRRNAGIRLPSLAANFHHPGWGDYQISSIGLRRVVISRLVHELLFLDDSTDKTHSWWSHPVTNKPGLFSSEMEPAQKTPSHLKNYVFELA